MRTVIICLAMTLLSFGNVQAQNDPVLTGMIYAYTDKAEKELKNQEKVMLMQTTGHIWMKEEVEGTTNLQREFNNYLNSFRSIVVYAAQVYGFYHEIDRLVDNLGGFTRQLDKHPSNAIAVALSAKRNKIYRELIMGSVEIVNDIRQVRQHRTIPALRLKHHSGGCGTASALPKCSIIHKVLSVLLA